MSKKRGKNEQLFCEDIINFDKKCIFFQNLIDFFNVKKQMKMSEIVKQLKVLPKFPPFVILSCHDKRNNSRRDKTI